MIDAREQLLADIQLKLDGKIKTEQLLIALGAVTLALNGYSVERKTESIVVADRQNDKLIKMYTACLNIDGKSKNTIAMYDRELRKLDQWLEGKHLTEIGPFDIRMYLGVCKERGLSNRTLENTRSYLSAFFRWAANENIIKSDIMASIRPVKYQEEEKLPLSDVEVDRIRSACRNSKERALIELLVSSGVRVSELCNLDVSDVDLQKMTVKVRNGKGGKNRTTYITPVAAEYIKQYLTARCVVGGALFIGERGRYTPSGIRNILNDLSIRSGVDNVHPHRFRRTFATRYAKQMKIQDVQRMMGHSDINTTMIYIKSNDSDISAMYKSLSM